MPRSRKILIGLLVLAVVAVLLPAGALYWRARRALPAYEGEMRLDGLREPVRVLRDSYGVPHIYAETLEDLVFAQGFVHAQERLWQMDMLRRTARGRLSEVVGRAAIALDKENRLLGLGRAADRAAELLNPEERRLLESYSAGVNAYIESRQGSLWAGRWPVEFALLGYRPEAWQPSDSLAVGLSMFKLLTNRWKREIARLRIEEQIPAELAADLFVTRSEYDHPAARPLPRRTRPRRVRRVVAKSCGHPLRELLGRPEETASMGASNNWVVAGRHTASGAPLLANDMHLPHTVPAIWFVNHLTGPGLDVRGFSLPGRPFVIVGHNRDIAWGFTNLGADVQDLYVEHFDRENPGFYLTPSGWAKAERRTETINVQGGPAVKFEVLETRHGPVVHEDGEIKFALRWTALDAPQVSLPFLRVNRASNWEEFTAAMEAYGGPAQNAVYADREGHIGYHAIGRVPNRKTSLGSLPVPGDSAEFDWDGFVPFERMPQNFDPPEGYLATANNRVVPAGYPVYITDQWMHPSRVHRIYLRLTELIEEGKELKPEDMLELQGDTLSLPNLAVARYAAAAADNSPPTRPATKQAIALLRDWDGDMSADGAAPVLADSLRVRLMEALLRPQLGEDWRVYNWWMAPVFLENTLRERPARWLPSKVSNYDRLILDTLEKAVTDLLRREKLASPGQLNWGDQVALRMRHPVGDRLPFLRGWFSPPRVRQSGGRYSVKQTTSRFGPSERLVVDWSDLDQSLIGITLGQSGHVTSRHYDDQFEAWHRVLGLTGPFSQQKVEAEAGHILRLLPR